MITKPIKKISILLLGGLIIFWAYVKVTDFFVVDACLDKGGVFNVEENRCECEFNAEVLETSKYSGGIKLDSNEILKPRIFKNGKYTIVTGFDSTQNSTLGLYFEDIEILSPQNSDGIFDTIINININNDDIPDFLVSYEYEDGASLLGLISTSRISFKEIVLFNEWTGNYCLEDADRLINIIPLTIKDIDNDGKVDIIVNLAKKNGELISISCTDTILGSDIILEKLKSNNL